MENLVITLPSKAHVDYFKRAFDIRHDLFEKSICKMLGVKYLMVGSIKVKETSTLKYAGHVFPVIGYYMKWSNLGLPSDGWDEYRVSLVGSKFEGEYCETNLTTGDIEWIQAEKWEPPMENKTNDLIQKLVNSLSWYVEQDDVIEGDATGNGGPNWDLENAYWIEGLRNAEAVLKEAEIFGITSTLSNSEDLV
jgi:hypothetical protein